MTAPRILLCTVGTGTVDQLRETLLEPLTKSIRQGAWDRVILLPSQLTADNAARLRAEVGDVPITIRPLPAAGLEDNPDACFGHFDAVLAELRAGGAVAADLLADFTRGTKAMSAALVLAAVRHGLGQLRYITGPRWPGGMVQPGHEVVVDFATTRVTAHQHLETAGRFLHRGNFAAARQTLDPAVTAAWPDDLRPVGEGLCRLAQFYAAWDRLDFATAHQATATLPADLPSPWRRYLPPPGVSAWVAALADLLPDAPQSKGQKLRPLVADLLANGERRLRDQQFEDAIIRGYRVLELVGQVRLLDRGFDAAALPPGDPQVAAFQAELVKKKSAPLGQHARGHLLAAREQVARFLKFLGDRLGKELMDLGKYEAGGVRQAQRNYSVWIHGFESVGGNDPGPLPQLFDRLGALLLQDDPAAAGWLATARFLDFTRSP